MSEKANNVRIKSLKYWSRPLWKNSMASASSEVKTKQGMTFAQACNPVFGANKVNCVPQRRPKSWRPVSGRTGPDWWQAERLQGQVSPSKALQSASRSSLFFISALKGPPRRYLDLNGSVLLFESKRCPSLVSGTSDSMPSSCKHPALIDYVFLWVSFAFLVFHVVTRHAELAAGRCFIPQASHPSELYGSNINLY